MSILSYELEMRFWSLVDSDSDPTGCWPWTGPRYEKGYGRVGIAANLPTTRAHRLAYGFAHGEIPALVRHSCDNPPCCNPEHLLAGDAQLNAQDMHERGRFRGGQRPGSRNVNAKVTEEQVLAMRGLRFQGVAVKDIADVYGVSRGTASKIVTGKIWTHVPMRGV